MENHSENIVRTEDVIGKEVKSLQLESLGKLAEIVLDKTTGQVRYVVISVGEWFGFGGEYHAFPWKSLSFDPTEECFILNVPKDKINKEYGFDKDHWPDAAAWPQTVDRYYEQYSQHR